MVAWERTTAPLRPNQGDPHAPYTILCTAAARPVRPPSFNPPTNASWSCSSFQELRADLGLETTRGWKERTVLRAAPCLFGLFSVVSLLSSALPAGTMALGAVSYRGKTEVTFSDAITAVRRQLWLGGVPEPWSNRGV